MVNRTQFSVDAETKRLAQQVAERQDGALSDSCRQLAEQVNEAFNKLDNGVSLFLMMTLAWIWKPERRKLGIELQIVARESLSEA